MKLRQIAPLLMLIALLSCRPLQKELPRVAVTNTSTPSSVSDGSPALVVTEAPFTDDSLPVITNPEPSRVIPHNEDSFTQGLLYSDGFLYESTGRNGSSYLNKIDPASGKVVASKKLSPEFFGEGLALLNDRLYQLTWKNGVCLTYKKIDLTPTGELFYRFEGWGLTLSPSEKLLVFSDGSDILRFMSASNFVSVREIATKDGLKQPVYNLNELEWVKGEVWANVWMTDRIVRINPKTGAVIGWISFPKLTAKNHLGAEDVLNGIAYDPTSDRLWITGKLWKSLYQFDQASKTFSLEKT